MGQFQQSVVCLSSSLQAFRLVQSGLNVLGEQCYKVALHWMFSACYYLVGFPWVYGTFSFSFRFAGWSRVVLAN